MGVIGGFLRPIHTIQKYGGDIYEPSVYNDKIIAFVGDCKVTRAPRTYILPPGKLSWGVT